MHQANIRRQADAFKIREDPGGMQELIKSASIRTCGLKGLGKCIQKSWPGVAKWRVRVQEGVSSPVP